MKSLSILVAAASVAVATFDNLPSCGQVCMSNMNNIAINEFGCAQGNIVCYCQKVNYGYGIRDCANEACSSPEDAANVISYGSNYCAGALSSAAPSTPSAPGYSILSSAAGGVPSGTGASPSPTGTGTGTGTGAGGLGTAVSTVSGTATVTSGSQVLTTTGAISTIFSSLTAAPSSVASSLSSVVSSVNSSLTSEISGAASSAAATGSAIESSLTASASGSATSTSSEAGAALATAAPLLGAGAMAVLLAAF
ncbi:uncharacterized protein IWZ02DRAFT_435715 [Phyllosticta citriasiana]|uniref:uncharacterized protein n=1 Tax=Phyllosticta citriasiana TaxID=595635 RepID=UPI0030FD549C